MNTTNNNVFGNIINDSRILAQLQFIVEIDKLKSILRQTQVMDSSRPENSAEHSWHLAMMALVLAEHSNRPIDVSRVIKLLLIHDIVEIDAGDTFLFDSTGHIDKNTREQLAAERIFAYLPTDQAAEIWALWNEFEAQETAEAQFAALMDHLQPVLQNFLTNGGTWSRPGVSIEKVVARKQGVMERASITLWKCTKDILRIAKKKGILTSDNIES